VARLLRDESLLGAPCRSLYLTALRALHIDAVVVSDYGQRRRVRRYVRFFRFLLGPPRETRAASVFSAGAAVF
jgi:hypothetical protein